MNVNLHNLLNVSNKNLKRGGVGGLCGLPINKILPITLVHVINITY